MRNHFTPRKKKIHGPSVVGAMKTVRIDANTLICVPASIPDDEARERFIKRTKSGNKPPETYMPPKIQEEMQREIASGSIEELQTLVEDIISNTE